MREQIEHAYSQIENIAETLKSFKKTMEQYSHSLQQELTRSQLFINTISICKDHYLDDNTQTTFTDLLNRAKKLHAEFESCQTKPNQYLASVENHLKSFDQCQWVNKFRKFEQEDKQQTLDEAALSKETAELDRFEKELKEFFVEMDMNLEAQNQAMYKLRQSYQVLDDKLFSMINPSTEAQSNDAQGRF